MEASNGSETDSMSRAEPNRLKKAFYYRHRQKKNMHRIINPERALKELPEAAQHAWLACTSTEWAGM